MTKIVSDITKIAEEIVDLKNGSFTIKNVGGGLLTGNVMTDNEIVSFEETKFEGNEFEIKYTIDVRACKPQELLKFNIYIISNGGEITIPVFIKVLKNIFYTEDGYKISTIKDLFSYSKKSTEKALKVFYSDKFATWLSRTEFEYTDLLRMFLQDPIKERALDNFFIFCKIKKKSYLQVVENNINVTIKPFQNNKITGTIVAIKKGYGHIYKKIEYKNGMPWLNLQQKTITSSDFNDENRCYLYYEINPQLVKDNFSIEQVIIDENTAVKINVSKLPKFVVSLSDEIYEYERAGYITIENNCDKEMLFEISAKDNFVEFDNKYYVISDKENIYFKIKRSRIQNIISKVSFNKKLYMETEIYIKTVFGNKIITKTKKIILGTSLL